ncbi:hypothetical protein [Rhodococcus rhodochrous]|uniref:Uncharacterized protein n=1 Tax=Rhodococcus rhodochrous KG-21 TaxID=1441923 RepID=A0A0M8PMB3_RHORH|nr:hypothetical protein [Rhodococcus rhodochrous]KOS54628.1 hypothetical protein Z051_19085 [Rhodococcus rhodochrous KG-21]
MGEVAEFPVEGGSQDPVGPSRQERLEALRRQIAAIPARGESARPRPAEPTAPPVPADRLLPVPEPLARLLPDGGLARGSVVSFSGATSLLLGVLASATAAGGHAAVVGHRRLGLLAAAEMGAELSRIALIPDPGPEPVEVAAVLLDGMDLVVLGLGGAVVPPSRARAVVARARSKGAALVVTDGRWDGAHVRLEAAVHGYRGLSAPARGRLCGTRFSVRAQGRSFQPRSARMDLCAGRAGVEWRPGGPAQVGSPRPAEVAL